MNTSPSPKNPDSVIIALSKTHFIPWFFAVIFNWFIIFLAFFLVYESFQSISGFSILGRLLIMILISILAILVIGSRHHAIAILGHEGTHGLITKPLWLNDLLAGLFCFWPLGSGGDSYRDFHLRHHHNMGMPLDPELEFKQSAAPQWDLPIKGHGIARRFIKDLLGLGYKQILHIEKHIGLLRLKMTVSDLLGPAIVWVMAISLLVYFKIWWVLPIWFLSLSTSFWAFFRLRMWTEHLGTPTVYRLKIKWWQRIFLPHNTWYHYEHHRWSTVPFWKLPAARKLDTDENVQALDDVFEAFGHSQTILSGTPLHNELEEKFKFFPL